MTRWLRDNVATVAGWAGMAAMLLVGAATQWSAAQSSHAHARSGLVELEEVSAEHTREIVAIKSDVRSIRENQSRLDEVVTRQEGAVRDLEKLTIEIRAIVRAKDD